jgi:peptidoglycan/xylan/chitin deacetylase (PgdA/CDA1 family)
MNYTNIAQDQAPFGLIKMITIDRRKVRKKKLLQFIFLASGVFFLILVVKKPLISFAAIIAFTILSRRIMLDTSPRKVPVLYYHSISDNPDWLSNQDISIPTKLFEKQLKFLKDNGYVCVSLSDVYNYVESKGDLPPRAVVLTFDDGYLDNWVSVYPLLKKYNMQGTLFVTTGLISDREDYRPNLEDVWNKKIKPDKLNWEGYLSWAELKQMHVSGVLDIQSHTVSHIKKGELLANCNSIKDCQRRVYEEVTESKRTLENMLNKKVDFLAWPGEETNNWMFNMAVSDAGYLATTGFWGFNAFGGSPKAISRIFIPNNFCSIKADFLNMLAFKSQLHLEEGNFFYYLFLGIAFLWGKLRRQSMNSGLVN